VRAPLPRLHVITDERIARRPDLPDLVSALASVKDDRLAFHARGRTLSGLAHWELTDRLSAHPPVRLFVNDRLDVALAARAAGVQLGGESLPPAAARRLNADWWIGRSVHSLEEARSARAEGADYLLAGPVFETASHPGASPMGIERLEEIVQLGSPVIAIGGVSPERAAILRQAGVYGVAAIRALWDAPEPAVAARHLLEAFA
jgi:thiamine-phosphate diphosphorylase